MTNTEARNLFPFLQSFGFLNDIAYLDKYPLDSLALYLLPQ